jgi:hypothetical protein
MLRRLMGDQHELAASGDGRPMTVCADAGDMEQVLANLCMNAKEAMPSGGTIRIGLVAHPARPDVLPPQPLGTAGRFRAAHRRRRRCGHDPRLSGMALAGRLRQVRPRLPVLFSAGYAFRLFEEGFVPSPDMEVIRKPFTHRELLRRVRDLIDTAKGA